MAVTVLKQMSSVSTPLKVEDDDDLDNKEIIQYLQNLFFSETLAL
jgi:hypothetical protein